MRILSPPIAAILALAATVPASSQSVSTGSHVASLRCVQFAMVREHRHNPAGWPTDCDSRLWPQSKKG
jgi:hypothetical protein